MLTWLVDFLLANGILQEMECQQLSDVKVPKRMRIGVLPTIERFGDFVRYAEKVFVDAERRTDVERHYERLCRATMEGIQRAAVSPNSKSPALIVKAENYHQLYRMISVLVTSLSSFRNSFGVEASMLGFTSKGDQEGKGKRH